MRVYVGSGKKLSQVGRLCRKLDAVTAFREMREKQEPNQRLIHTTTVTEDEAIKTKQELAVENESGRGFIKSGEARRDKAADE